MEIDGELGKLFVHFSPAINFNLLDFNSVSCCMSEQLSRAGNAELPATIDGMLVKLSEKLF
jgi:hypothetical protein